MQKASRAWPGRGLGLRAGVAATRSGLEVRVRRARGEARLQGVGVRRARGEARLQGVGVRRARGEARLQGVGVGRRPELGEASVGEDEAA